jgi:transposase
MEVVAPHCAGLDVHRSMITACALLSDERGRARQVKSQFVTTRAGLERLATWLRGLGVTVVGMESTGVYWMPVFAVLEAAGGFQLLVLNPEHVKGIKGRKSDMKDAEWLADLIRHGLVRGSFVPPKPIRELRDLTRYRRTLVENQGSERRRLIKLLEAADIKLAGVVSDIFGVSGRAILRALIEGGHSAVEMSKLLRGRLRQKRGLVIDALAGGLAEHQRDILAMQLARVEADEADIAALDRLIDDRLVPYAPQMALLMTIPGIDRVVAATVIAEIGVDMSVFPSHRHLAAWGGTCPGNHESAGKRKPIGARKGNLYLKTALCNAATAASRKRGSFFKAKYHKLKSRRGGGRAALAIAHKLLVCIYHMLSGNTSYRELGENYFDLRDTQRAARRYVRRLQDLGFSVILQASCQSQAEPVNAL